MLLSITAFQAYSSREMLLAKAIFWGFSGLETQSFDTTRMLLVPKDGAGGTRLQLACQTIILPP